MVSLNLNLRAHCAVHLRLDFYFFLDFFIAELASQMQS